MVRKQNEVTCFCFKKKIKKDVRERVKEAKTKYKRFDAMLKMEDLDVTRILKVDDNK